METRKKNCNMIKRRLIGREKVKEEDQERQKRRKRRSITEKRSLSVPSGGDGTSKWQQTLEAQQQSFQAAKKKTQVKKEDYIILSTCGD